MITEDLNILLFFLKGGDITLKHFKENHQHIVAFVEGFMEGFAIGVVLAIILLVILSLVWH